MLSINQKQELEIINLLEQSFIIEKKLIPRVEKDMEQFRRNYHKKFKGLSGIIAGFAWMFTDHEKLLDEPIAEYKRFIDWLQNQSFELSNRAVMLCPDSKQIQEFQWVVHIRDHDKTLQTNVDELNYRLRKEFEGGDQNGR